jgi:ferredoxin
MLRDVVVIDEGKCNGCGNCVPGCPEGALQIIDNKARLVSDLLCDGLGACIGECPQGAITIDKKETGAYDEEKVMDNMVRQGENTIKAHLKHLEDHGQTQFLKIAVDYLEKRKMDVPIYKGGAVMKTHNGCPGSKIADFSQDDRNADNNDNTGKQLSELRQWPVQLHLVSPTAPYYQGKDLLLAADCVGFSMGNFHRDYLRGKSIAIACPKLDSDTEVYVEKLTAMIDEAKINTMTVMIMQVPCCGGLLGIAKQAAINAQRKVPVKAIVISLKGDVLSEEWV